jgi:pimeloyl-ACP methyl ester carboxylesterase
MAHRTRLALVLAGAVACALALPAAARTPAPGPAGWVQPCGGTSWFAGSTDVCDGTVVYRDYVNDDEGADSGGLWYDARSTQNAFGTLAPPAGDVRYPDGQESTADLVRLTLTRVGNRVDVVAEVAALHAPRSTVLALAIDTDGNPRTGGGTWPGLTVRSAGWDRVVRISSGDPRSNTLRGSFPLPRAATWRVQAVTAQAATGTVMNAAFRGVDEQAAYKLDYDSSRTTPTGQGAWFEDRQAAALRTGDVSAFGYTVRTANLRRGTNRLQRIAPGLHERVYTSRYALGEGMSYAGVDGRGDGGTAKGFFAQAFNLLGRYQPYGVYLPLAKGPLGLQMEWHGSNQGIVAQINQPGMQQRFGEDLHRVLVVPEARGPNGYGSDLSERDLLDVLADASHVLGTDPARTFSSGYSQGGYLAFRMAMLYPDRFAGFTSWVGFTGDDANGTGQSAVSVNAGAVGNMIDYVGNLRHVPGAMLFSGADELVQVPSSTAMQRAFAATDDVYTWYLHPAADHFTYALADDWAKEAAISSDERLVSRPARVTFRTDPLLDSPQYGIRHDRAYWVGDLRGRATGPLAVDLTSQGCGVVTPELATTRGVGTAPVPWTSIAQQTTGSRRGPAAQVLTGTLSNVRSVVLSLAGACLRPGARYRITSYGPATVRLSDGYVLHLPAGTSSGTLR